MVGGIKGMNVIQQLMLSGVLVILCLWRCSIGKRREVMGGEDSRAGD